MLNGADNELKPLIEIRTDEQLKITVNYIKGLAKAYETEISPKILEETEKLLGEENFDRLGAIDFIMNAKVLIDEEWEKQYAQAQERFMAHKKQKAEAKAADAAATPAEETPAAE